MNLADVKIFLLPINTALPPELAKLNTLTGSFAQRVADAERVEAQAVLPLSAAEAATIAAHPEVFNLPLSLYLSHVPGAAYDPLIDAAIARMGAHVAIWDAVKTELNAGAIEDQRRRDAEPWTGDARRNRRDVAAEKTATQLRAPVSEDDGNADE